MKNQKYNFQFSIINFQRIFNFKIFNYFLSEINNFEIAQLYKARL
jgi:hypothetical protein